MEISSPAANEHEVNIEEEIAEMKADDVPERQTRQSSRRRRSTGASQSVATPSPSAALRSASPNSPRIKDKPRSGTGQKPPSKGEQIEPIPEQSLEESVEEDMRVEDDEDAEDGEEVKTSSEEVMDRMSQPADEDQTQELPVQSNESTPAPQGRRDSESCSECRRTLYIDSMSCKGNVEHRTLKAFHRNHYERRRELGKNLSLLMTQIHQQPLRLQLLGLPKTRRVRIIFNHLKRVITCSFRTETLPKRHQHAPFTNLSASKWDDFPQSDQTK